MTLSWLQIVRLGVVQMCIGAVVVLTTTTFNRLMVVELALPAMLPGFLVGLHYAIQITRPNWGFLSDTKGQRTRFIIGGMAVLALGGFGAAAGVVVLEQDYVWGLVVSLLAYVLIGIGVAASGTCLLALLATATAPERRAAAATITWLMMIGGIAITAGVVGQFLDPYSPERLLRVVGTVVIAALMVTTLAIWGVERRVVTRREPESTPFLQGFREIWAERRARIFTFFVFLSMTAFFMQELIIEPYAGLVFGYTPGQSTSLSGLQHAGVFVGMVVVGIACSALRIGPLRNWVVLGCIGSALGLSSVAALGNYAPHLPLAPAVIATGFFNGVFTVAAISAMMAMAGKGRNAREGTRMGMWGAAQAIAAGFGGFLGTAAADLMRSFMDDAPAFGTVFMTQALLFLLAAWMAARIIDSNRPTTKNAGLVPGE